MDRSMELAEKAVARCRVLASFSESSTALTRTFLSPPMRECHRAISEWMQSLGMPVETDAIGNLRGVFKGGGPRRLIIGSHIDTVPNAGAFDGVLGVTMALALIEALATERVPFEIEVIAFSEEEGVRFRTPFLGSRALVGKLLRSDLEMRDEAGITLAQAIRNFGLDPERVNEATLDANRVIAFVEFHIEQGPVLDNANLSIAVVESIAGQSRFSLTFTGASNHAGTTPMRHRRDAITGAAEWVVEVERAALEADTLVATVGRLTAIPNASNVIAGEVQLSLDVRHRIDDVRLMAVQRLLDLATKIAARRNLQVTSKELLNQPSVCMHPDLVERALKHAPFKMASGAGHDAMILAPVVPSVMLFIRSPGGVSHHPGETVRIEDVASAIRAGVALLKEIADTV